MSDVDYEELDEGIRHVVRYLRGVGYDTTDSGDGLSKFAAGTNDECTLRVPHVVVRLDRSHKRPIETARRLRDVLVGEFGKGWEVQASYDTKDGEALLFAYRWELT